jgi:hypothetical protein
MVDKRPNLFDVDGINIYMTYDDAVDVFENQDIVDGSPLVDDSDVYPLVAEGFFGSDGVWYFHKIHSASVEYKLGYEEFIDAVHETK